MTRYIADRNLVRYLGMLVEVGPTEEVIANLRHPDSRALLSTTLLIRADERHVRADGRWWRGTLSGRHAARRPLRHPLALGL